MAEETKIPAWALKEAFARSGIDWSARGGVDVAVLNMACAFADVIIKHEQPPVDRATHIAREMLAIWSETTASGAVLRDNSEAEEARKGGRDTFGDFMRARDYLAKELGYD